MMTRQVLPGEGVQRHDGAALHLLGVVCGGAVRGSLLSQKHEHTHIEGRIRAGEDGISRRERRSVWLLPVHWGLCTVFGRVLGAARFGEARTRLALVRLAALVRGV
jgi:hypothetical protein